MKIQNSYSLTIQPHVGFGVYIGYIQCCIMFQQKDSLHNLQLTSKKTTKLSFVLENVCAVVVNIQHGIQNKNLVVAHVWIPANKSKCSNALIMYIFQIFWWHNMNTRLALEVQKSISHAKKDLSALKSSKKSKKPKRDRKKNSLPAENIMQRNVDIQADEITFPHQPFCIACFFWHVVGVMMFIPPREPVSVNIFKKIIHSFYQQGDGFHQCRLIADNQHIPHQSFEDALQAFDFGPQVQQTHT